MHLTNLIRLFIGHAKVSLYLLICSLIPIVKDNLGDLASSDNYRAIAIGSEKLSLDQFKYGYQALASTTMCTWRVNTVVEFYNRRGRRVYGTAMDCLKACDMVRWTDLFMELRKKGLIPIFLRLLLFT